METEKTYQNALREELKRQMNTPGVDRKQAMSKAHEAARRAVQKLIYDGKLVDAPKRVPSRPLV